MPPLSIHTAGRVYSHSGRRQYKGAVLSPYLTAFARCFKCHTVAMVVGAHRIFSRRGQPEKGEWPHDTSG